MTGTVTAQATVTRTPGSGLNAREGGDEPSAPVASSQQVVGFGLWSVAKVSLVFYSMAGLCLVTACVVLSVAARDSGVTAHLQHLGRIVFKIRSMPLGPADVGAVAAMMAALLVAAGTAVNLLAALVYNRCAHLAGGLRADTADAAKSAMR